MNSAFVEASDLIRIVGGTDSNVKGRIRRAAQRIGVGYERAKAIWYGEARRIDSHELDTLRAAARQRKIEEREKHAGDELHELRERIAQLESRVADLVGQRGAAARQDQDRG